MREVQKGISLFLIVAGAIAVAVAWSNDRPDQQTWVVRFVTSAVAVAGLIWFLLIHFHKDEAPDFLHRQNGRFFDRDGFCFTLVARPKEGVCFMEAWYQNRFDQPCLGRIALRPTSGLFNRRETVALTYEIPCEPAAFGVARIALPVPASMQGNRIKMEVGASVKYPVGKGRMLRFRDGIVLRANSEFGNTFRTAVTIAGALGGMIVLSKPASIAIVLPSGVAEELPNELPSTVTTLWKLGDPIPQEPPDKDE